MKKPSPADGAGGGESLMGLRGLLCPAPILCAQWHQHGCFLRQEGAFDSAFLLIPRRRIASGERDVELMGLENYTSQILHPHFDESAMPNEGILAAVWEEDDQGHSSSFFVLSVFSFMQSPDFLRQSRFQIVGSLRGRNT